MAQISSGKPFCHKQGDVGCKLSRKRYHGGVIRAFSAWGGGGLINSLPTLQATLGLLEGLNAYDPDSASLLRDPDAVWIAEQIFDV